MAKNSLNLLQCRDYNNFNIQVTAYRSIQVLGCLFLLGMLVGELLDFYKRGNLFLVCSVRYISDWEV